MIDYGFSSPNSSQTIPPTQIHTLSFSLPLGYKQASKTKYQIKIDKIKINRPELDKTNKRAKEKAQETHIDTDTHIHTQKTHKSITSTVLLSFKKDGERKTLPRLPCQRSVEMKL